MKSVKPINLSRTKITYLCGASLKTHFDQFKESTKSFGGIPSELVEIDTPEIRVGEKDGEEYSEIVIPAEFEPGSIMLFATDMDVSLFPLSSLRPTLIYQSNLSTLIPTPPLVPLASRSWSVWPNGWLIAESHD